MMLNICVNTNHTQSQKMKAFTEKQHKKKIQYKIYNPFNVSVFGNVMCALNFQFELLSLFLDYVCVYLIFSDIYDEMNIEVWIKVVIYMAYILVHTRYSIVYY